MKITILDDYQDCVRKLACAAKLEPFPARVYNNTVKGLSQLATRLKDAEVVVLIHERTQITRQVIEKLPMLRLIAQVGRVGSHIDLQACTEHGVAVAEGDESPLATAELTWALIMAANRRLPHYLAALKHGAWQQPGLRTSVLPPNFGLGRALKGQLLGIWGYGRIGQLVANYGKAFGMSVMVWGSPQARQLALENQLLVADSQEQFFSCVDILSLHLRLSEQTAGIVTLRDLMQMKPTSLLVNTARSELIAPDALIAGLNRGRPGMAAVDVYETEPVLQGHPLLRIENCICTPHIGHVEQLEYEFSFNAAFDNVINFASGTPTHIINPMALNNPH